MLKYRLLHFSSTHYLGAEELAAAADHEAAPLADAVLPDADKIALRERA